MKAMSRSSAVVAAVALAVAIAAPVEAAGWSTRITSLSSSVYGGHYATASVSTHAGARCSITVTYRSGVSHAAGLGAKTASSTGKVAWRWKVGTSTAHGLWPVRVSCRWGGVTRAATKYFRVK